MSQYRESGSGSLSSIISGAVLGAAGLAWWLFSEAEKRQKTRKHRAMLYAPRIQDGSEAFDQTTSFIKEPETSENLERKVEQLNAAIADVRKQLENLGSTD